MTRIINLITYLLLPALSTCFTPSSPLSQIQHTLPPQLQTTLHAINSPNDESSITQTRQSQTVTTTRATFFQNSLGAAATAILLWGNAVTPADAKEIDPALKGTKGDPEYQLCVSNCLYECTKPKGGEQKSRAVCIPECKEKCATSKEQLLTGTPKK
mmetsp:Transcript_20666/g.25568  ORF Transcript_20666/g.25568 Transcript_20666/m.25568 type:complete len:157 (+) Transcript_20666:170-640(+)